MMVLIAYCPCDTEEYYYVVNEGNCEGDPCIKIMRDSEEKVEISVKDCTLCDVLDLNGKIGIELKTTGEIIDNK